MFASPRLQARGLAPSAAPLAGPTERERPARPPARGPAAAAPPRGPPAAALPPPPRLPPPAPVDPGAGPPPAQPPEGAAQPAAFRSASVPSPPCRRRSPQREASGGCTTRRCPWCCFPYHIDGTTSGTSLLTAEHPRLPPAAGPANRQCSWDRAHAIMLPRTPLVQRRNACSAGPAIGAGPYHCSTSSRAPTNLRFCSGLPVVTRMWVGAPKTSPVRTITPRFSSSVKTAWHSLPRSTQTKSA